VFLGYFSIFHADSADEADFFVLVFKAFEALFIK